MMGRDCRRVTASAGVLLVLAGFPLAGGCFSQAALNETGIRIGDETLKQFKAGTTTESWLVAVLGPPTSWTPVEGVENTKVFRYASDEESSGILSGLTGGSKRNTAVTYFIISDGVVTRFWSDRATEYTALGKPVEAESGTKSAPGG